ncbi:uncharacterized protein LOC143080345 [Mytilus galloprovincialis]|uniref:uncharacterized protein LOC143080345 n=1 Tax=Mytilus galloprovincialis TaxID=29158 RepID=UPI003F7BB8A7
MATCNFVIHINVVRCPLLSTNIPDGYRTCQPSGDMVKGTVCQYGCYQGHDLKGQSQVECTATGSWSTAQEHTCEKKSCTAIVPRNNLNYTCSAEFYFRSICTYTCSEGYDIPENTKRTNVCLASGKWNTGDPTCVDMEPPTFEQCPNTLLFYTNENEDSSYVHWNAPIVKDNKDLSLIPRKISGPSSTTLQNVGTYIVTYEAEDSNGNRAEDCTFAVVVKQLRCRRLYPSPYMTLSCTGTRLGSQCSFSCDDNAELNGTHTTFCHRESDSTYSQWDMYEHPFCQVTETCQDLKAPKHGAIACDNWLGGRFCHPLCAEGFSVMIAKPLPALLVCLDDGKWLFQEQITDCYALGNIKGRPAVMSAEFYYTGDCNNPLVQNEIKQNFIITIQNSISWNSKCQPANCYIANVVVVCGSTSRKRSTSNLKIDVEIYFGTENTTISSTEYEKEVLTVTELMFVIENEFSQENVTLGSNQTIDFLGISSHGLEIQCHENSVPVYGNTISCLPCPAGSYYDNVVSGCIKCKRGSYQPKSGQSVCIICSEMLITAIDGAIDSSECEEACVPGTWSTTGLPPCIECDIGYYEESYGSVSCSKCPGNKITLMERRSNVSECIDFDIGFPNMSDVSYTDLVMSNISFPFLITLHAKCDTNSSGTIFRLSSDVVVLLELSVKQVVVFNETLQMPIDLCQRWVYVEMHVKQYLTIMYIDRKEVSRTFIKFDLSMISGFNVILGGSGFSGYISQFNIRSLTANAKQGYTFPMCSSEEMEDGYVNWEDFAYSNLLNAFINIPGQCDDVDDCNSNPCVNGTCMDKLRGYRCTCNRGFTGSNCDVNIDDCVTNVCQNDAQCLDGILAYSCLCSKGYKGELCEIAIVDGGWTRWDDWTKCSTSCGNGTRHRGRSCSNPLPDNGGLTCNGTDTEIGDCTLEPCPECFKLQPTNNSSLFCNESNNMIVCYHNCDDGYWFDQDVRPEYRCGNETYYLWDFQTKENPYARLPSCSQIQESLMIYVNYTSYYDLWECESETELAIASEITNGYKELSCYRSSSCIMTNYVIHNCNENDQLTRRDISNVYIGYTVTLACNTTKHGTHTCYFGLADAVMEMKSLENNGQSFNIIQGNNTYHISQNQSTSGSWLKCPFGSIANVAFCVPCSIGHYLSNEECLPCQVGTYQLLTGQTFCFVCPTGTTTEGISSISINDCNKSISTEETSTVLTMLGLAIGIMVIGTSIVVIIIICRHRCCKPKLKVTENSAGMISLERVPTSLLDNSAMYSSYDNSEFNSDESMIHTKQHGNSLPPLYYGHGHHSRPSSRQNERWN